MPRSSSSSRGPSSFQPSPDPATYRDLLLFEERLKANAAHLKSRKSRYQYFLAQLLVIITFLLAEVFLNTELLSIPYVHLLRRLLPDIYAVEGAPRPQLHPYVAWGMLFVSVTTLILFFASGLYSEKIGYANKYVPHANKALRSFNMYLNVRQPPLTSRFPILKPLSFLFPRTTPSGPSTIPSPTRVSGSRSPSPGRRGSSHSPSPLSSSLNDSSSPITQSIPTPKAHRLSHSVPLSPIPPATNPRGELIFSSRVDRTFREGYERYRAAFERARESKERDDMRKHWRGWMWLAVSGGLRPRAGSPSASASGAPTPTPSRASTPQPISGRATPDLSVANGASLSRTDSPKPRSVSRQSRQLRPTSKDKTRSASKLRSGTSADLCS